MVRLIPLRGTIDFADPEAVFSFLYADDQFYRRFHKDVTSDPNAEVTDWSDDGVREVKFKAVLDVPKLIRRTLGADLVNVKERQIYKRDGDCFTITSEAVFDIPGGDRFVTAGQTTLGPDGKQGCIISMNATLEFKANVWGIQGTVESYMESQAKASFEKWMAAACQFCQERKCLTEKTLEEDKKGICLTKNMLEDDQDEFFDADGFTANGRLTGSEDMDQGVESNYAILNLMSPRARNGGDTLELQSWIMQRVLKELTLMQLSSDASHSYMEKMNAKLLKMEEDLRFVRSHVAKRSEHFSKGNAWCLYGLGITTGLTVAFILMKERKQN